jgi:hypothetical protein
MKLTFQEQLQRLITKSHKNKNFLAYLYYSECLEKCCACASWETFSSSAAGIRWIKDHQAQADELTHGFSVY